MNEAQRLFIENENLKDKIKKLDQQKATLKQKNKQLRSALTIATKEINRLKAKSAW